MSKNFKIGIENFRVFKEMTEFDLRPLTILVGPNNSGKSSFTKLLLLLKNGFDPLDFKKGEHHLGSYRKSSNWDTESEEMVLKNEASYFLSPDQFTEEIRYNEYGGILEQTITNNKSGQKLLNLNFLKMEGINTVPQLDVFSLDINYIIDSLYNKEILVDCPFIDKDSNFSGVNPVPLKRLKEIDLSKNLNLLKDESLEYLYDKQYINSHKKPESDLENNLILNSILMNEIDNLEKDYLLYNVFVNDERVMEKAKILECQNQIFYNYDLLYNAQSYEKVMRNIFISLKNRLKHKFENEYGNLAGINNEKLVVKVEPTILGQLIFSENLFKDRSNSYFSTSLFQRFKSQMFTELIQLEKIEYIPVNRGNQSRVLLAEANDSTYSGVSEYHNNRNVINRTKVSLDTIFPEMVPAIHSDELLRLILEKIGITGKITTKHFEDTAAVVYIERKGKEINLADFGFGYSQLIPIILKIYNLSYNRQVNSILIIEEPEANLHPNLQAKLADIFALVIKHNPNWKVIVETHSEYIIRKLQYLVAKQEIEREDCIIYYFNSDENVSQEEAKVKSIEINEEGNLTDNFGPGFFDEATRLQFDLLKLNKPQSN